MASQDTVHADWAVQDLEIFVCTTCGMGHVRRHFEPVPRFHVRCRGCFVAVKDHSAKRAMLKLVTQRLFSPDLWIGPSAASPLPTRR